MKHFTLKDADALHVWNGRGRGPWLHNRRRQSEITALCHLWQGAVVALDKTNDEAEWRISARSVTYFHWTGTDPIHSDRSRSRVSTKIGAFSNNHDNRNAEDIQSTPNLIPNHNTSSGNMFCRFLSLTIMTIYNVDVS